jgi:hypothetical protein
MNKIEIESIDFLILRYEEELEDLTNESDRKWLEEELIRLNQLRKNLFNL